MKKVLILVAIFAITAGATAQLKISTYGNVGIGTNNPDPASKLHVFGNSYFNGNVRISAWTDFIFDWTGKCCGSPVMYPENDWYLQLGKKDRNIGTIYTDMLYCRHYQSYSDERSKENIIRLESPIIEKVMRISGYRYNFTAALYPENLPNEVISELTKTKIGFLAQELERIFPELVTVPDSTNNFYSVDYMGMIPVLVEAIKEQQAQIQSGDSLVTALAKTISKQQTQIERLQEMVVEQQSDIRLLMEQIDKCCSKSDNGSAPENSPAGGNTMKNTETFTETAKLFQNVPNPFSVNTEIRFEIPENASTAKLIIHDMQGAEIKSYSIAQKGLSSIVINGFELPAGMYMYTLLVNNTMIDTKKMILTK